MYTLIITSILSLAFGIYQIKRPYKEVNSFNFTLIKDFVSKYNRIEHLSLLIIFPSIAIGVYVTYLVGGFFTERLPIGSAIFNYKANSMMWIFPGMAFGLSLSIPLMRIFIKMVLRSDSKTFFIYINQKYNVNSLELTRIIGIILSLIGITISTLLLNISLQVYPKKIIIYDFPLPYKKEIKLSKISDIVEHTELRLIGGETKKYINYLIFIENGDKIWTTKGAFIKTDKELINWILLNNKLTLKTFTQDNRN